MERIKGSALLFAGLVAVLSVYGTAKVARQYSRPPEKVQSAVPLLSANPPQPAPAPQTSQAQAGGFESRLPAPKSGQVQFPPNRADKLKILALLRGKRYAELETLLESVQKSFENDPTTEYTVFDSFEAFDIVDPAIDARLQEWQSKYPQSFAPLLAQAAHAWASGWAAQDPTVQTDLHLAPSDVYRDRASKAAEGALAHRTKLIMAHTILITLTNTQETPADTRKAFDRAAKEMPESLILRAVYMSRLAPIWGGNYKLMADFAEESSKVVPVNPNMQILWGYMYFDQARTAKDKGLKTAPDLTSKALRYGDYWYFLQERGEEYLRGGEYEKALADLNRTIELRPNLIESVIYRASALWLLHRFDKSKQDFHVAATIDPPLNALRQWQEFCVDGTLKEAGELLKKDQKTAMDFYDQSVSLLPDRGESYLARSGALSIIGKENEAKSDLQKACDLGVEKACAQLHKPKK